MHTSAAHRTSRSYRRAVHAGARVVRQSRSTRRSPRSGVHDSTTSLVASAFSPVMTTSVMSATNIAPSACSPALPVVTGPAATARPATFASPGQSRSSPTAGWNVGPCSANRGSRARSAPLCAPRIEPKRNSPSVNSHSMPEMRGEPSARSVAIVLWRPASNSRRTRSAKSGSACSIALHPGTSVQNTDTPTRCHPARRRADDRAVVRAGSLSELCGGSGRGTCRARAIPSGG